MTPATIETVEQLYEAATPQEQYGLAPCPFCGAGSFEIHENGRTWQGTKYSEPISVEVRHWCVPINGQPSPRMLAFVGRDTDSAVAAWNRRAPFSSAAQGEGGE